jgi:hypothetical protein
VVIDALTRLEFEVYTVDKKNKEKLLRILSDDIRNVIYICIVDDQEAGQWLAYVDELQKLKDTFIQIGVFLHTKIPQKTADQFLMRNVPVIRFSELVENTLDVMKKVLIYFDAKGKRHHIRARSLGGTDAYFTLKNITDPIKAKIIDISVDAFSCDMEPGYKSFFEKGVIHHTVLLVLRGIRVRVAARVVGYSVENPNLFILKYVNPQMVNGMMEYGNELDKSEQEKIHTYIRQYLNDYLEDELGKITE